MRPNTKGCKRLIQKITALEYKKAVEDVEESKLELEKKREACVMYEDKDNDEYWRASKARHKAFNLYADASNRRWLIAKRWRMYCAIKHEMPRRA